MSNRIRTYAEIAKIVKSTPKDMTSEECPRCGCEVESLHVFKLCPECARIIKVAGIRAFVERVEKRWQQDGEQPSRYRLGVLNELAAMEKENEPGS